jgi:hypothetical protein
MNLEWLGQFRFRTFQQVRPNVYAVVAYHLVGSRWVKMDQFDRGFPDSNYVGAYYDSLCAKKRNLGVPTARSFISTFAAKAPVLVRMFVFIDGQWTVQQECKS